MNKPWLITLIFLIFLILSAISTSFLISPKFPTVSNIYSPLPTFTSRLTTHFPSTSLRASPLPTITLIAVGDIMLGRMVNVKMLEKKDWHYPFLKTASTTAVADITFGNLESPIINDCPTTSVGMIFCGRPESIEGLKFAGFDILSVANNHILNYGPGGLSQTTEILDKNGIVPSSANKLASYPVYAKASPGEQANNLSFGFFSFDLVSYPKIAVVEEVKKNANKVDVLVVSLHWGVEYAPKPLPQQKELAQKLIEAGAKVIIGHHPHVVQPTEKYQNGLIFYSLGNFVFDQPWSEATKKGKIAKIIFKGKEIKSYEEIPIYIEDYCQPKLNN